MIKWLYKKALELVLKQHNLWRRTNGEKGIRLSFAGKDIERADFTKANLYCSTFIHAILRRSDFEEAQLDGSSFQSANLGNADFTKADFFKANMTETRLRGVRLNIHINNRQKDDLEAMQKQAEKLWPVADLLPDEQSHMLRTFLANNKVRRPRGPETIHFN